MCFSIDFPTEYSLVPPRARGGGLLNRSKAETAFCSVQKQQGSPTDSILSEGRSLLVLHNQKNYIGIT
jgi:hypothetical protein